MRETRRRHDPPARTRTSRSTTLALTLVGVAFLLPAVFLAGCDAGGGSGSGESREPAAGERGGGLSAAAQAALDSGNAAYREGDYEAALERYRHAAEDSPDNPSPVFGIRMAAQALGDSALADSALLRLRELTPEPGPVHPAPGDTGGG